MKKILVLMIIILFAKNLFADQHEEMPKIEDYRALQSLVVYPQSAIRDGIEGKVIVAVWIPKNGKATKAKIVSSTNHIFDQAALTALMTYQGYIPAKHDNQPVGCWLQIPFNFKTATNYYDKNLTSMDIEYDADKLIENILKSQKESMYFGEAFVETVVNVDGDGQVSKIKLMDSTNEQINGIIKIAIQNTKFLPAIKNKKSVDSKIKLYIEIPLPKEKFDFEFNGNTYTMNFKNENNNHCWFADLLIGTGKEIKTLDTIKLECIVFDKELKQLNKEKFTTIYDSNASKDLKKNCLLDMKAGSERLLWLHSVFYYQKEIENYLKNLDPTLDEKIGFLKIKVLEIIPNK
jgi:TonB family protein